MQTKFTKHSSRGTLPVTRTLSPMFKAREYHCLPLVTTAGLWPRLLWETQHVYSRYRHCAVRRGPARQSDCLQDKEVTLRQTVERLAPGHTARWEKPDSHPGRGVPGALWLFDRRPHKTQCSNCRKARAVQNDEPACTEILNKTNRSNFIA